MLCIESVDLAP